MSRANVGQDLTVTELLPLVDVTATAGGTGIDIRQYSGKIAVIFQSAAGTGTTPTLDIKLQDDDAVGGSYGDITGATFTQVTDGADITEKIVVDADACKAFIRAHKTIGGTSTPTFGCGVTVVGLTQVIS